VGTRRHFDLLKDSRGQALSIAFGLSPPICGSSSLPQSKKNSGGRGRRSATLRAQTRWLFEISLPLARTDTWAQYRRSCRDNIIGESPLAVILSTGFLRAGSKPCYQIHF